MLWSRTPAGGDDVIESEPDRGTNIRLLLPRGEGSAPRQVASRPLHGNGQTFLVVEDNADMREFSMAAMRQLNYRPIAAENALIALERLSAHPEIADLFTDVILTGGMSGRELANVVRNRYLSIKIVLTSGYVDPKAPLVAGDSADILVKPYHIADLAQRLRLAQRSRAIVRLGRAR